MVTQRRAHVILLIAVMLVFRPNLASARPTFSIIASCQFYHWASRQELSPNRDIHRLYLIDPRSGRKISVTRSSGNDYAPRWSSDRRVLYLRQIGGSQLNVCMIRPPAKNVITLYRMRNSDSTEVRNCTWSPDGKRIGFIYVDYDVTKSPFILLNPASATAVRYPDVSEYAWAPDSNRLFLRSSEGVCRILNLTTGKSTPFAASLWDPVWLDNTHLLGTVAQYQWQFAIADGNGQILRRFTANTAKSVSPDDVNYIPDYDHISWHKLPNTPSMFILEVIHEMSDGNHSACYTLNVNTGRIKFLGNYEFHGFSPDGQECLVSSHEWVGPYKRGGERVGPLEIFSLTTGKAKPLTSRLTDVYGADWFR